MFSTQVLFTPWIQMPEPDAVGPGQSFTRFTDITEVLMAQQVTPIDRQTSHLRWQLYHRPGISDGKMRVNVARMRDLVKQVRQDIPLAASVGGR